MRWCFVFIPFHLIVPSCYQYTIIILVCFNFYLFDFDCTFNHIIFITSFIWTFFNLIKCLQFHFIRIVSIHPFILNYFLYHYFHLLIYNTVSYYLILVTIFVSFDFWYVSIVFDIFLFSFVVCFLCYCCCNSIVFRCVLVIYFCMLCLFLLLQLCFILNYFFDIPRF